MTNAITDPTTLTDTDLQDTLRALHNESDRRRAIADIPKQIEDATARYQDASGLAAKRAQHPDGTWPDWAQPSGALDTYGLGDHTTHNGKVWISTVANNVWEPGVSGWREETTDGTPAAWVQPTGAHDAYRTGDRVTYQGHVYESTIDANVWAPDGYPQGWKLIS